MPNIKHLPLVFGAVLLAGFAAGAQADEDWLITRVNGQWTWESAGPEGRVRKSFLNQEVLRRTADGLIVVVSALPIAEGDTANCSEKARHNPKEACSSAFLACQPSGGAFSSLLGLFGGGAEGAADKRNGYRCAIDTDAVLDAALAVGLIERSELDPPSPSAEAKGK